MEAEWSCYDGSVSSFKEGEWLCYRGSLFNGGGGWSLRK